MSHANTILVATDLSAPARHAVGRAAYLASVTGDGLCILHAMELDSIDTLREMLGDDVVAVKSALSSDARARLDHLAASLADRSLRNVRTQVAVGSPLSMIAAEADALHARLVVIGARGESFLRHALLGSTAARLVRKSVQRPVLIVKQPPHEPYRSIVIAVDFSPVSLATVRMARKIAPEAEIVLLHAFELPFESKLSFAGVDELLIRQYVVAGSESRRKRLHDLAAAAGLGESRYATRICHGDPAQQIIAMEQEYDADLIVVGKHGTNIAEELLLGSVTKHVLAESQCDVLVMCDPQEPPEELR